MSLRPSTLLWMLFLAMGFFGIYMVKYKVQAIKTEVAATERQLLEEKKNLHVLEAEWSYLNRPERLTQLTGKYLQLASVNGQQMADYTLLPIGNPAQLLRVAAAKSAATKLAQKPAARSSIALASGTSHGR